MHATIKVQTKFADYKANTTSLQNVTDIAWWLKGGTSNFGIIIWKQDVHIYFIHLQNNINSFM